MKTFYGMTLDPDVAEEIKRLATSEDRSFSYYVNQILSQHLSQITQPKPKPIKKK